MKFIHLSDLHLGKRLREVSLTEDQIYILRQILDIIDSEQPEAVLISGDIYDKSVPSGEAVTIFDDFLFELSSRALKVFIISGNHDSPERLSFGGRLMNRSGIHISPVYSGKTESYTISDEYGDVRIIMLPFIKPISVRRFFPEEELESYTDAVRAALGSADIDTDGRNVLLAHQFVTGAEKCESEEISVGGIDNVDVSLFDVFDYVALGHIHGPQNIASEKIRYCGTLLKYSFSEANHIKSVTVAELREKGNLTVRTVPLTPMRDLREIRGSFKNVSEGEKSEDYLRIILTDEEDIPGAIGRLRSLYPNIITLEYDNTRTREDRQLQDVGDIERKSPLELFDELYEYQNNRRMSDVQRKYTRNLIESIREA